MRLSLRLVLAFCFCLAIVPQLLGAVVFDEVSIGEFSEDNTAPTELGFFVPGAGGSSQLNSVLGSTEGGTADIFTFEIASGNRLNSLFLSRFDEPTNSDFLMYVAISRGEEFPSSYDEVNDPDFPDTTDWLGGSLISPGDLGNNILPRMANTGVGSGFTAPLGDGKYTVYVQQQGPLTGYGLDFNVSAVPEPSTTFAGGFVLLGALVYRRCKRKKKCEV